MDGNNPADATDSPAFFEAHYERILRYVQSMVHNAPEAEDLTQESFLRAYKEREPLRGSGALVAWLYRIATHVALDKLRQRARRAPHEADVDMAEVDLPDRDGVSLEQGTEQGEMSACVQEYLADFPDNYRSVILLHDMEELTGSQIAELLDLPLATVKMRLHRARQRLQAALRTGCDFSKDERNVLVCESKN